MTPKTPLGSIDTDLRIFPLIGKQTLLRISAAFRLQLRIYELRHFGQASSDNAVYCFGMLFCLPNILCY